MRPKLVLPIWQNGKNDGPGGPKDPGGYHTAEGEGTENRTYLPFFPPFLSYFVGDSLRSPHPPLL